MQNNRYYSCIRLLFILMLMACTGGCIKEDRAECPPIMLKVKAVINVNGEDQEVGKETVKEIMFYVFDENEEFLGTQYAELGSTITLYYPPRHNKLHLVCWGNSASDLQIAPTLKIGDKIDETLITVIADNTKATEETTTTHPDNLFHSKKELITKSALGSTTVMIIRPQVATINITARGLKEYFDTTTEEFYYILRSGKKHISFSGNTTGNDVHHTQQAEFKNGLHESDIFNILPSTNTSTNVKVDIYHGSTLLHTISTDNAGNPIQAEKGKLLNIYANFIGNISIGVAITPWGEKAIWKEIQ